MSIAQLALQLENGQRKSSDLVAECLQRIDKLEPMLHAWVCVDREQALADAQELDREFARGNRRSELHGIPIGVKDIIDVRGYPTRAGSPLTSAAPVMRDAAIVSRLREAGAVILGKTVTTEYASFDPPPTRNPWNLDHTPGGSSSGSAAAVAVGMCVAALGTQTGGSVIRPASYCGVCGFKPSFGRLPVEGIVPFSQPLDHPGPIAGCVADLQIMFRWMVDPNDRNSSHTSAFSMPPRLGVLESYFLEQSDASMTRNFRQVMLRLQQAGAVATVMELPAEFREVRSMHRVLMAGGAAAFHRDQFLAHSDQYGVEIASLLREGLEIGTSAYQRALDHQRVLRGEMAKLFHSVDVLLTPATPTAAPTRETTGDPKFNSPWSFTGLPSVSLPCALSENGLPISLQIIAPFGADEQLLEVAAWIESRLPFDHRPPLRV